MNYSPTTVQIGDENGSRHGWHTGIFVKGED